MSIVVKITPNDKGNPVGKLADAELHFIDGELDGVKLIRFGIWERRGGNGRNVTFPARFCSCCTRCPLRYSSGYRFAGARGLWHFQFVRRGRQRYWQRFL